MDDRTRWNEKYRTGQGPTTINPRLEQCLPLLKRGRALDLACGIGQNAQLLVGWDVVLVDISEEALVRASGLRVQADAAALPFLPSTFDTIINTRFFEPRVDFYQLLTPGGTLFFETYTLNDLKYRPEFRTAPRFDPAEIHKVFSGLEILRFQETDDGHRVFGTVLARKPELK